MGVVTDLFAFETRRFEKLRKERRLRALASALIESKKPPIPIVERTTLDKASFSDLSRLLEVSLRKRLDEAYLEPGFFLDGCARIADPRAQVGYWDPFYALSVFDDFDELADYVRKSRKRSPLARVTSHQRLKQPGDTYHNEVWAYRPKDLETVFGEIRASFRRADQPAVIDAFFTLMKLLHRAFEPLTPAGRVGQPWTIVTLSV